MNYDWKTAVLHAENAGAGSSGQLCGFDEINFRREGKKWIFTDLNKKEIHIRNWAQIPVETIHFKGKNAHFARVNSRDKAVIDELTRSIMRGDVKITGPHACVNNIGNAPVPGCPEIEATVPVPIMCQENMIYAQISSERVTRGSDAWNVYTAHIEESTGPGNGRNAMQRNRIYMCGGL